MGTHWVVLRMEVCGARFAGIGRQGTTLMKRIFHDLSGRNNGTTILNIQEKKKKSPLWDFMAWLIGTSQSDFNSFMRLPVDEPWKGGKNIVTEFHVKNMEAATPIFEIIFAHLRGVLCSRSPEYLLETQISEQTALLPD